MGLRPSKSDLVTANRQHRTAQLRRREVDGVAIEDQSASASATPMRIGACGPDPWIGVETKRLRKKEEDKGGGDPRQDEAGEQRPGSHGT